MITRWEAEGSLDTKGLYFEAARSIGLFRVGRYFQRNKGILLILCYHGISKSDEHLWRPALYMPRSLFRQRLQTLQDFGYQVLPFSLALQRLYAGTLNEPTVVLTFDDGWHDFYQEAWPELRSFGFPATVYQTTYYSLYQKPVFDTACSYLLWKGRGRTLKDDEIIGTGETFRLDTPAAIHYATDVIMDRQNCSRASAAHKEYILAKLAAHLRIDWNQVLDSRLLHLMTMSEIAEISRNGVDVQLHTHRHRIPVEKKLFLEEIYSNQTSIKEATGKHAAHFCYPNGCYRPELPVWLREAGMASATTCEPGLVGRQSERLLLPRVVDSSTVSQARFESWLAGVGLLAPTYKRKLLSLVRRRGVVSEEAAFNNAPTQAQEPDKAAVARAGGN